MSEFRTVGIYRKDSPECDTICTEPNLVLEKQLNIKWEMQQKLKFIYLIFVGTSSIKSKKKRSRVSW